MKNKSELNALGQCGPFDLEKLKVKVRIRRPPRRPLQFSGFQFQGQGVVGPESSFMYQNQSWIDNGIYIGMLGVIIILIGYFVEKKKLM